MSIGITGIGTYFPQQIQTAADLAALSDIPEEVLREKIGLRQRHVAGDGDTVTHMATLAAQQAITDAGIDPAQIKLVVSHGSEYKDHILWNAAGKIQHNVGAVNAFGFELHALCASAPIALNMARSMMLADPTLDVVLLAAGTRENDIINLKNQRARFMFSFGAGGGAMVLQRAAGKNTILASAAITDGSLADTVMLTREPDAIGAGAATNGDIHGWLDVRNGDYMAERLGAVSLPNFLQVITDAVEKSGKTLADVNFLGITHMKRSFYRQILAEIGLTPEQSVYLEDYGHVQSADQAIALQLGLQQGKIQPGDLVVLAGAGTGYTWSAIAVQWG